MEAFWCTSLCFYVNSALPHHFATAQLFESKTQYEQEVEANQPHFVVLSPQKLQTSSQSTIELL